MNQTTLTQVIYRAMTDTTYALNVFLKIPVTPDNYGDYETIAKSIRSHYRKYDEPFSKEALTADVVDSLKRTNKDSKDAIDTQIETITTITRLAKQHNYSNDKDIEFKTDEWSRTRLATNAIMRNLGSGKAVGDPKVIENLIKDLNEATNIGNISELGETVSLFDAEDTDKMVDLLSHVQQNTIPLNLPSLDHLMGGGLSKGEMGMILSQSGRGKTTTLVNIAKRYAVDSKQNVLYLALEERVNRLVLRAFRAVTNQNMGDIYDSLGNPNMEKLKKQLTAFQQIKKKGAIGDLDIFASKPQIVSPTSVEQILQQYMLKHGHYPDILIIDYPDLMENPYLAQGVNEFRAAGMLYEAIRRIAGQYQMVVWVASQMNRMSSQQEIMNAYAIEGSKQKLNTVELCMSLNQTDAEFKAGFMRFYIDKVRNPGEGTWDKIIKFKVNVNSMTYNEETPEESAAHDEVLSTKEQGPFDEYKKPKMSAEQARKKTAEANAIIASQNL